MTIWKRLLRALLWAATALCVAKDCHKRISIVGVEGEDTVLSPLVAGNGNLTKINWKKGENIVAGSIFPPRKEKLSLDSSSGNLFIKNLSKEDTGNYTAYIFINEKITEVCFELKILVQPDINCTVYNDTIRLNCASASQEYLPLKYTWDYIRNEEVKNMKDPDVLLPRNSKHFQKITCYVKAFNSITNNSISWSDCNILEEELDHQSTSTQRSFVVPIITVLVVVLILGLVCYIIKKRLKKNNESESGARDARANCKEVPIESKNRCSRLRTIFSSLLHRQPEPEHLAENSELQEERKSLTKTELKENEKSEESSELPEEERKPFTKTESRENEKSEESSELPEEEIKSLTTTELKENEKSEESSELPGEEIKSLATTELKENEKSEETSGLNLEGVRCHFFKDEG